MGCILRHHGQNGIIGRADHIRHLGSQDCATIWGNRKGRLILKRAIRPHRKDCTTCIRNNASADNLVNSLSMRTNTKQALIAP